MSSTGPIVGPFQIARAYGVAVRPVPQVRPVAAPQSQEPAKGAGVRAASRLVAGGVPGRVSFAGAEPQPDTGALAMYRHPADTNAAATGVSAGRLIDVEA
jgi:hypothetical protein